MQTIPHAPTSLLRKNLQQDPAVIYALDPDLRITWCNQAWDRFAVSNGGRGLESQHQPGRSVLDAIPRPLKAFFTAGYLSTLLSRQPWEHSYECSSSSLYRSFRLVSYPDPEQAGIIVVNSLTIERPHDPTRETFSPDDYIYLNESGMVKMCCHCRRTARVGGNHAWDWVRTYVDHPPPRVTHGICPVCMSLFYLDFLNT